MVLRNKAVHLIGAGDPWVCELEDVATASGLSSVRVLAEGFLIAEKFAPSSNIFVDEIAANAEVFLAFQTHPSFKSANHAIKVQRSRQELLRLADARLLNNWINLLHPASWISPTTKISTGVFVGANASVGANSFLGKHCTVNRNASIGHDVSIGDGVEVNSNSSIAGGVIIDNWAFVGSGATILNDVHIGEGSIVAAGSVVTKHVPAGAQVYGVPAKSR